MTRGADKSYSLREIAERFGGEVLGDPETRVSQVAAVQNAAPGTITFLSNERYLSQLKTTRAAAVILGASARNAVDLPRIVCGNPYAVFARVSAFLNPPQAGVPGIHATAVIDPDARIAAGVEIGPLAVIGRDAVVEARARIGAGCHVGEGSVVGEGAQFHACVTIYHGCSIGKRVILHSGVVIGADGFGIALENERWIKVPQLGGVTIGDDVEIGANTTVDRGAIDDTVIEEGVKLDNQIQVGHNVRIGAHTAIAACVGISGSVRIGRHCQIGGGTGIAGHVTIADRVVISANTSVTKSIEAAGVYSGLYPFESNRGWRRNAVHLRHLDELVRRVRALEDELGGKQRRKS